MQTYKVQANDQSYIVIVEPKSKRECRVTVNEALIDCACDRPEEIAAWVITREGVRTHARSRLLSSDEVEVWIGGLPFQFSVKAVRHGGLSEPTKPTSKTESGEIRAIMPGRVTSIMVKLGDQVSVGTPLLILEAMKMQNEIVSHKPGRVTSIRVREGASVKKDTVLLEVR